MARKLIRTVESLDNATRGEATRTVGEALFPGVKNPTGHLLDTLKRRA